PSHPPFPTRRSSDLQRIHGVVHLLVADALVPNHPLVIEYVNRREIANVPLLADRTVASVEPGTPGHFLFLLGFLEDLLTLIEIQDRKSTRLNSSHDQ